MGDTIDQLLTAAEAAAFLGLKTATIRRMTFEKRIPCCRPTGRRAVRYRLRDLQDLVRMGSQPARTEVGRRRHRPAAQVPENDHNRRGEDDRNDDR